MYIRHILQGGSHGGVRLWLARVGGSRRTAGVARVRGGVGVGRGVGWEFAWGLGSCGGRVLPLLGVTAENRWLKKMVNTTHRKGHIVGMTAVLRQIPG